tara:strand:- start:32 stop:391 length:360 start_codon:yes stop_codon:yes gene_type:complete
MDYNNLIILYSEILNEKYKNVDVDKLANIYFGGKVISRNIFFKDGSKKTLGIMLEGRYEFQTSSRENMEIHSGEINIKIEGAKDWTLIKEGMNFNVPKNSSFCLDVIELVNYTCSYYND